MEDRIYYVESPEGGVIGPLTMIQILEGLAAEAILENARLCEVGREEWVELGDVVSTRNGHGAPEDDPESSLFADSSAPAVLAPTFEAATTHAVDSIPVLEPGGPPPIETELVDSDLDEEQLHHIQTAALHDMDLEMELREEDLRVEQEEELQLSGVDLGDQDSPDSEDTVVISPDAYLSQSDEAGMSPDPYADAATADAAFADSAYALAEAEADAAFHEPLSLVHDERIPLDPEATIIASPDFEIDREGFVPFAVEMETGEHLVPRAALHPTLEPASGEESDDFRLDFAEAGDVSASEGASAARRFVLPRWIVPALIAVGAPAVLVIYFLTRSDSPKDASKRDALDKAVATVTLPPASDTDQRKAQEFLDAGRAKLARKDAEGALPSITKAIELDPHLVEAHKDLAHALASTGRKSPAIEEMTAYLADFPEDMDAQRERLDWMMATGQSGEAGILYGELASKKPESAALQTMAGLANGDSEDAVAFLRRAIALEPKNRDAWIALGAAWAKLGKSSDAVDAFEKAFALRPANSREKGLYAQAMENAKGAKTDVAETPVKPARSPEFAAAIHEIDVALELENYDDAMKAIDAAKKKFSKDPEAARNLELLRGITELENGKFDQAITRFEALDSFASYEEVGGGRGSVANWIARARIAKGDFRGAVQELDVDASSFDPNEVATAKLWEGVALQSLGMQDLAVRTWKQIPSEMGTLVQGPGKAAVKTAQFLTGALSEKEYKASVASVAGFENDMHYFLGRAALDRADSSGAASHFQKALEASKGREFPWCLARGETR